MLENVPYPLGKALRGVRAGRDKVAANAGAFAAVPATLSLTSPAFADFGQIPPRYTADGEKLSPPLAWDGLPSGTAGLVLIVEDPDAPSPTPLVHALAWDLDPSSAGLAEGELKGPGGDGAGHDLGRNAYLQGQYLPPDPPTGHGPHGYVFQLFALDRPLDLKGTPTRTQVLEAMAGHVLAKGMLIGCYERI